MKEHEGWELEVPSYLKSTTFNTYCLNLFLHLNCMSTSKSIPNIAYFYEIFTNGKYFFRNSVNHFEKSCQTIQNCQPQIANNREHRYSLIVMHVTKSNSLILIVFKMAFYLFACSYYGLLLKVYRIYYLSL